MIITSSLEYIIIYHYRFVLLIHYSSKVLIKHIDVESEVTCSLVFVLSWMSSLSQRTSNFIKITQWYRFLSRWVGALRINDWKKEWRDTSMNKSCKRGYNMPPKCTSFLTILMESKLSFFCRLFSFLNEDRVTPGHRKTLLLSFVQKTSLFVSRYVSVVIHTTWKALAGPFEVQPCFMHFHL